jgi:hypothetical protein
LSLYAVAVVIDLTINKFSTHNNLKTMKVFDLLRSLSNALMGVWGMVLFSSDKFRQEFKIMNEMTYQLVITIDNMLWFRICFDLLFCMCQAMIILFLVTRGIDFLDARDDNTEE